MPHIEAQHPGVCADCDEHFDVGTRLRSTADGWAHEVCPDVDDLTPTGPVCDRCWLTRPCEHDDEDGA